jgi:hypothetical protein
MQSLIHLDQVGPTIEEVLASLRRLRIQTIGLEHDLQSEIAQRFNTDGIPYAKEHQLGPRNRIDFLIPGGIGVEVKKGKPNSGQVMAQVERYAGFPVITHLVLVVERNVFTYDRSANGKPVHYVALNKLWGISI